LALASSFFSRRAALRASYSCLGVLVLGLLLAVLVRLLLLRHAGVVRVRGGDHPEHLASDLVLLRGVVVRGLALGLYGRMCASMTFSLASRSALIWAS
jgi:hypothetical protein